MGAVNVVPTSFVHRSLGTPTTHVAIALLAISVIATSSPVLAREAGDPIRLTWMEGDMAGMTEIQSPDGQRTIGFVEYRQRRTGDRLEIARVSRFEDGSSDEDHAEARVTDTLEPLRGRSIIRDTRGQPVVDMTIDVVAGRISGAAGVGNDRETFDERAQLPAGTYWGPLISLVLKNFDANASDGRLTFRTVAATPRPRVIDLELARDGETSLDRPGGRVDVVRFAMRPTINWLLNPIIQRVAPTAQFFVSPGEPPTMARFVGPRNYARQEIRVE